MGSFSIYKGSFNNILEKKGLEERAKFCLHHAPFASHLALMEAIRRPKGVQRSLSAESNFPTKCSQIGSTRTLPDRLDMAGSAELLHNLEICREHTPRENGINGFVRIVFLTKLVIELTKIQDAP